VGHRLVGEFRPPPEIATMSIPRVVGKGTVETGPSGLKVEGKVLSAVPTPSRTAWSLLLLAVVLVAAFVPDSERILVPAMVLAVGGAMFLHWRAEYGLAGGFEVPWSDVEHVVRLASARDVVAIVFTRPARGWGSPEAVYFEPSLGVEAVGAALRADAPAALTMDLESGLAEHPFEPDAADEQLET
jgi:hypothetical protein